jgi:hypothetical protein
MTTPMPPQDSIVPDEKLPGETELAALYRQLPQDEPDPALDAAVLHAAAQALAPRENGPAVLRERRKAPREPGDWVHPKKPVASTPASPRRATSGRKRHRWPVALGRAAALILAVGLGWRMRDLPPAAPPPTGSVAPAQVSAATPTPQLAKRTAEMTTSQPAPPPPQEPLRPSLPRPAAAPPAQTTAASAARKAIADTSAQRVSGENYAGGGLASVAPPPAPEESASDSAAKAARPALAETAPAATGMPAAMAAAPAPAADTATPDAGDTPAQELDKIGQLFAQGHDDEARQRLAAFRHAYPQWDLPPELRAKLRKP